MLGHSGEPYLLVHFCHRCRTLGEAVEQHAHARLVKEIQNAIVGPPECEPDFPDLPLNLRGIRMIQCRPVLPDQVYRRLVVLRLDDGGTARGLACEVKMASTRRVQLDVTRARTFICSRQETLSVCVG